MNFNYKYIKFYCILSITFPVANFVFHTEKVFKAISFYKEFIYNLQHLSPDSLFCIVSSAIMSSDIISNSLDSLFSSSQSALINTVLLGKELLGSLSPILMSHRLW